MYYRLFWYPIFYRERIYSYLISDKYYFSSQLYNTLKVKGYAQIISIKKVKRSDEIVNREKEIIKQEDRIFGEDDIKQMMDLMEKNNYRENPICEYVLGMKNKSKRENKK